MLDRRRFLTGAVALAGSVSVLNTALANAPARRTLNLLNRNTDETLKVEYYVDGWYNPDALKDLNYFLRDWREEEVADYDVGVFDILYAMQQQGNGTDPIHVISGYRTAQTNARLQNTNAAVASNSYHVKGMAVDFRFPGVSTAHLRDRAVNLEAGGVGFYGRSDFLHIDTGPVRTW